MTAFRFFPIPPRRASRALVPPVSAHGDSPSLLRRVVDEALQEGHDGLLIVGAEGSSTEWMPPAGARRRLLLVHYPLFAERLGGEQFDLILAGHSHGGQVRLPWFGALVVPYDVGRYDLGPFDTPGGPLYVTSGIGTSVFPLRLGSRPEITVVDF